jgi:hypothetical protein
MSTTISLYTFYDETDTEDTYSTQNYAEADDYARRYARALVAQEYEWADSELIKDYRPGRRADGIACEWDPDPTDGAAPCRACGWPYDFHVTDPAGDIAIVSCPIGRENVT